MISKSRQANVALKRKQNVGCETWPFPKGAIAIPFSSVQYPNEDSVKKKSQTRKSHVLLAPQAAPLIKSNLLNSTDTIGSDSEI